MPNPPEITNSQERIQSILNDTQAIFPIAENSSADMHYGEWRAMHYLGAEYTVIFDSAINQEALAQGVDANLVKAIMYTEFSQGVLYGFPAQIVGLANSLYPMNIRPDIWQGLLPGGDFNDPITNIRAGITLIKRIQERVSDGSIEQVATLYNSLAQEQVTGYGARVKTVYDNQLWSNSSGYPVGYNPVTAEEYFGITTITNIWDAIGGFDAVLDLVDPDIGFMESIALNIAREGGFLSALTSIFDSASITDPQINAPTTASNFFNIFNDAGGSAYDSSDWDLPGWQNGIVFNGGNYNLSLDSAVLNGDGMTNVARAFLLSNGNRPGAQEISDYAAKNILTQPMLIWDPNRPDMILVNAVDVSQVVQLGDLNNYQGSANTLTNIDPLVLDLNGNGIDLQSYQNANVLFNMDADSYKEQTGWGGRK